VFFTTIFIAVGGVFSRSMARRLKWKTLLINRIQHGHKVSLLVGLPILIQSKYSLEAGLFLS
jgi:hypothetical protein